MDAERAAAAYPALEKRVIGILVAHDPSGLFALGAPRDEHDRDVHTIISALQGATSVTDVRAILERELAHWITGASKDVDELCREMAEPIWDAWCEFRSKAG